MNSHAIAFARVKVWSGSLCSLYSFYPDVVARAGVPARSVGGGSGGARLCSRIIIRSGRDTGGWKRGSSQVVMLIGMVRMPTRGTSQNWHTTPVSAIRGLAHLLPLDELLRLWELQKWILGTIWGL